MYSPNCSQSTIALQIQKAQGAAPSSFNSHCFDANGNLQTTNYDGTGTFDLGLPLPAAQTLNSNSLSFVAEDPKFRSALIQQFNVQVEQQFGANVFTLGYVGNIGQHLAQTVNNINQPAPFDPTPGAAPQGAQNFRLQAQLSNLGSVGWLQSEGISNYNSLQTSLQRRFTNGLAFDANYTWAKGMSDNTGFSQEGQQGWSNADPTRIRQIDYGIAENDIQNRFATSLNYELQYGRNFTGLKRLALHGWEANTIIVWQSGKPFSILNGGTTDVTSATAPAGTAAATSYGNRATPVNSGGSDRPNKVANLAGPKTLNEYFNTANYAPQPLGTIGTAHRNSEFGPHFRHVDLSLFKDFAVTERATVQFRAEAFDITNTPDYYIPNNGSGSAQLGNPNFGKVTNYDPNYNPRQLQFALKLQF